jgi:hypothetical protein
MLLVLGKAGLAFCSMCVEGMLTTTMDYGYPKYPLLDSCKDQTSFTPPEEATP